MSAEHRRFKFAAAGGLRARVKCPGRVWWRLRIYWITRVNFALYRLSVEDGLSGAVLRDIGKLLDGEARRTTGVDRRIR